MLEYKVIDNFLDEKYFNDLQTLFIGHTMSWFAQNRVSNYLDRDKEDTKNNIFYMTHMFYDGNRPTSNLYEKLVPLLEKLKAICLIRVKANFYPNTTVLHEHPKHIDMDFPNSGAILSLNTCDGYTKLEDGTKINSVANRMLLFDPNTEHCSTTTTNDYARINININYINV